ncbi:MAG: hypothetical protein LBL61_05620, partial [Elusimicrobiota bacterium]|nr:hypothetical protein [Elusimicrobiota bacterium]
MIIISNDYQVPFEIFSQAGLIAVPAIIVMLLIPIVLFIMNKPNLYSFDKNILLDDIFMCKFLLPSIIIVSGLLCFSSSITFILPFQLLGITILLFRALIILYKTNKWFRSAEETINDPILSAKTEITTYKQSLRIKYLENIKSYSEKEDVWIDTLNDENFSKKNQQGLIEIFIRDIKEIKREGEFSDDLESLLLLLNNNFDKINLDSKLFKKLAEYSINYYDDLQKYEENQKYFPHSNQKKIFIKLLKKAITEGRFFRGIFFNVVAEFAKKQGDMRDFFIKDFFDDLLNF